MNSLLSAIKAFVLKSRPAYKDYLGNGKYDVKKLPEECVPDSVTLPKDGNPGDILVKTETGSAWKKQEQGGVSRYIINGHSWNYNGVNYICTDETPGQIMMMYESGKDIFLDFNEERFKYTGSSFYTITVASEDITGIKSAYIALISRPSPPGDSWNCPYKGVCTFGVFLFNIQAEG